MFCRDRRSGTSRRRWRRSIAPRAWSRRREHNWCGCWGSSSRPRRTDWAGCCCNSSRRRCWRSWVWIRRWACRCSIPETKAQAGIMVAGYAAAHAWRPHEKYFLQAVGDQMLLGVSHTRLRTMVRTLGAADEKTGLLTRSSYLDCLVQESAARQVARHDADAGAGAGGSRARSCCGSTEKARWSATSNSWRGRCSR